MREIKFRAKGQTDGKWHYGLLVFLADAVCHIKDKYATWICDAKTVGQYSGFCDKNYTEIYEDDICMCVDPYEENYASNIYLTENVLCVDVQGCDYDYQALGFALSNDIEEIEVIGNKHDNPEAVVK